MKITSSPPLLDQVSRHQAGEQQKADRSQQRVHAGAEKRAASDAARRADVPVEQDALQRRNRERVSSNSSAERPNFYRFKDTSEFPAQTQRALNAYSGTQASSDDSGAGFIEIKSRIDTFA